tara:strand:+ start:105 stop:449 length:345 start_codon:yes stop_codon:yes gene_type:complete
MHRIIENGELNKFAKDLGKMVSQETDLSFKDLKKFISVASIKRLLNQYCDTTANGIIVNEESLDSICSDIYFWVKGCTIARQASEDKLECYWDNELNCMVFYDKKKGYKNNDLA